MPKPDSLTIQAGVCRRCGCTDDRACLGVACRWVDAASTLCNLCAFIDEIDPRAFASTPCILPPELEEMVALGLIEIHADGRVYPTEKGDEAYAEHKRCEEFTNFTLGEPWEE